MPHVPFTPGPVAAERVRRAGRHSRAWRIAALAAGLLVTPVSAAGEPIDPAAQPHLRVADLTPVASHPPQAHEPVPIVIDGRPQAVVYVAADQPSDKLRMLVAERPGPVTILLDERQGDLKPAAEQLAAVLADRGRAARVIQWDPADVRPLPLRWEPTKGDEEIVAGLAEGRGFACRVGLTNVAETDPKTGQAVRIRFDDPKCGYTEYGPRLRHDADVVLFGTPETSLAVAEIAPHLRRLPTANHPSRGGFFVHHLWSPFRAGFHGLYVACHDVAGAEAAVAALAALPATAAPAAPAAAAPVSTDGGRPAPLEDLVVGRFGRPVLDIAFAPDGSRVFAAAAGLGGQLFALSADGKVAEHRAVHHRGRDGGYQRVVPPLVAVDSQTVDINIGGGRYRYSLAEGFVSRAVLPTHGLFGKKTVAPAAATVLEDAARGRTYRGGRRRLEAVETAGRGLWNYDDEAEPMTAERLLHPRSLFPRAVSGDGKVLLVAGFGSVELVSTAKPANEVVMGLDTATGKVLWRKTMLVNAGSVVPLDDAFVVVDDAGRVRVLRAADGIESGGLRPLEGAARLLTVPGRGEILVIENDAFDRDGLAARVFLRPLAGGADRMIPVSGRVTDAAVLPDGRSFVLVTARGLSLRVAVEDGRIEWTAPTPSGGIVRLAPSADVVWIGGRDGVIRRLDASTGRSLGTIDLNPFNVTTPEEFVRQMNALGELPIASDARGPSSAPVEPSYRTLLDPAQVPLGPNLVAGQTVAFDAPLAVRVEAGSTYLVEVVASAAQPQRVTPRTRLEITVTGKRATANLPLVARLPLAAAPARRRVAFRADESGEVVLRLRAHRAGCGRAAAGRRGGAEESGKDRGRADRLRRTRRERRGARGGRGVRGGARVQGAESALGGRAAGRAGCGWRSRLCGEAVDRRQQHREVGAVSLPENGAADGQWPARGRRHRLGARGRRCRGGVGDGRCAVQEAAVADGDRRV